MQILRCTIIVWTGAIVHGRGTKELERDPKGHMTLLQLPMGDHLVFLTTLEERRASPAEFLIDAPIALGISDRQMAFHRIPQGVTYILLISLMGLVPLRCVPK